MSQLFPHFFTLACYLSCCTVS